jgi:uncharacterized protein YndB with AHSA1/START domain
MDKNKNNLVVEREERTLSMSRIFNAPREMVWKVYTDPALLPKWWGPRTTTTIVDKMDVQPGGLWRYIHQDGDGNEYGFNGVYQEVVAPERLSYTFEFEPMAGHICVETLTFEALPNGKTKITARTTFDTLEDLEAVLQSGMEGGAVETWDRLEELLTKVTV